MNDPDPILLRQQLALKRKQLELATKFGLLFYTPHTKQNLFHSAADFRYRLARCGNRFGKSDMGVSEDLAYALGERPWIPKHDPLRYLGIPKHPTKGLVIAADDDKIDEIFTGNGSKGHIGKIWKKIPKELVVGSPKKSSSGTIVSMRIKGLYGESVIDFDTRSAFKNNPMGAESSDHDWVHIDEPIEEAHFKAIHRGLTDRMGKAWFTCTLIEQPWINKFFFDTLEVQKAEFHQSIDPETQRKIKWVMTGSVFDNPYLSQEAIDDFLNTLTEEERACRISGIPMYLSGLVFKTFDYATHVLQEVPKGWKAYNDPPRDYTIHVAIDPHPRTPHAVLFIAVSPCGVAYVYDEIFTTGDARELAALIEPRLKGRHTFHRKMDPSAYIEDQRTKTVFSDELTRHGVWGFEKGSKDLIRGISCAQQILRDPGALKVSPLCRTFIWEISTWAWEDKMGVPTNKPVDKDDHMMENFRRLCVAGLIWTDHHKPSSGVDDLDITSSGDLYSDLDVSFNL